MPILAYLVAVLIWGTDAAITKRFLLTALPPTPMVTIRLAVAGVTLLPFVWHERTRLLRLPRRSWLALAALVLVGTLAMNLTFYLALERTPAFITLILFRLEPIFIILISALFLHQHTTARVWLLTLTAIICGAVISLGGSAHLNMASIPAAGVALVLIASICSAVGTILAKDLLQHVSPTMLTALRTNLTALCLLPFAGAALARELPAMPAGQLALLLGMGAVYSGLNFVLYYIGLRATSPLVGSLMQLLRIVSGLIASFALLGERPTAVQWAGTLGLMSVLYLLTRENGKT